MIIVIVFVIVFVVAAVVSMTTAVLVILLKIHQRGVQWKQGVVIYMMLCTSLLSNSTPIHCTPLRLHPPLPRVHLLSLAGWLARQAAR